MNGMNGYCNSRLNTHTHTRTVCTGVAVRNHIGSTMSSLQVTAFRPLQRRRNVSIILKYSKTVAE